MHIAKIVYIIQVWKTWIFLHNIIIYKPYIHLYG
jgi:hypothetical protein